MIRTCLLKKKKEKEKERKKLTQLALHSVITRPTPGSADARTVDAHAAEHAVAAVCVAVALVSDKHARARAVVQGAVTYFARASLVHAHAVVQSASAVKVIVAEVVQLPLPAKVKVVARGVTKETATRSVVAVTVAHGSAAVKVAGAGCVTNLTFGTKVPIF